MSFNPEQKERRPPEWRGTLPSWFSVILLGAITYMGKGVMDDFKETKMLGINTDKRVTVLELQNKSVQDSITELRLSNKDILGELRAINASLQKR